MTAKVVGVSMAPKIHRMLKIAAKRAGKTVSGYLVDAAQRVAEMDAIELLAKANDAHAEVAALKDRVNSMLDKAEADQAKHEAYFKKEFARLDAEKDKFREQQAIFTRLLAEAPDPDEARAKWREAVRLQKGRSDA